MKTIFKKLKKGFTIVELVIVIAVIAILAAVLIPTLANLIESANESNDMVTVKNLNTIVSAYDTVGEIETVNDALDGALENGYSVSNLTPTSEGNVIVYDEESNRFALLTANALTADAKDDDVIYKDSSTTKTDWTGYTTWVFIDASATTNDYVTITPDGDSYTISGTNSYILTGTDWNGRSVTASYGLVLYDTTKSVTLNTVTISNSTKTSAKANTNSSSKTAIAKTTTANSGSNSLAVNVKAANLSCNVDGYVIENHSAISVSTAVIGCQFNEHGSSKIYDTTKIGDYSVVDCNGNLDYENIKIYYPEGKTVEEVFVGSASVTVDYTALEPNAVAASSVTITAETDAEAGTISVTIEIKKGDTTITITSTVESGGAATLEEGTEANPWLIASADDLTKKIAYGGYCKVTSDEITITSAITIAADANVTLDLNGCTLTVTGTTTVNTSTANIGNSGTLTITDSSAKADGELVVSATNGIYNNGTLTIEGGTIKATDSSYALQISKDSGTVDISGVTIKGAQTGIMLTVGSSNVTIENVTVTDCTSGIVVSGFGTEGGKVYINSCTVTATDDALSLSGNVTVDGGTYTSTSSGKYALNVSSNYTSNVTVNNGTFTGTYAVNTANSETIELTILGGTFKGEIKAGRKTTVEISGGTVNGNINLVGNSSAHASMTISGGSFDGTLTLGTNCSLTITGGKFTADPKSYLASGYTADAQTLSNKTWYIVTAGSESTD